MNYNPRILRLLNNPNNSNSLENEYKKLFYLLVSGLFLTYVIIITVLLLYFISHNHLLSLSITSIQHTLHVKSKTVIEFLNVHKISFCVSVLGTLTIYTLSQKAYEYSGTHKKYVKKPGKLLIPSQEISIYLIMFIGIELIISVTILCLPSISSRFSNSSVVISGLIYLSAVLWYFVSHRQINCIKYYLIGQSERIVKEYARKSGINYILTVYFILGVTYIYISSSILYRVIGKYSGFIDFLLVIHVVWSMLIFIVCCIYSGYLHTEYTVRGIRKKQLTISVIFYVILNIVRRCHRICGISAVFGALVVKHWVKLVFSSRKVMGFGKSKDRYDQIEMEILNYIVQQKYSLHKKNKEDLLSSYWCTTKSMFIGKRLTDFSVITSYLPVLLVLGPITLQEKRLEYIKNINIIFPLAETDWNFSLFDAKAIKNWVSSWRTGVFTQFCIFGMVFLLFVGLKSLIYVGFRTLFLLKDRHVEDRDRTASRIYKKIARNIYITLLSFNLNEELNEYETSMMMQDATVISTLNSL